MGNLSFFGALTEGLKKVVGRGMSNTRKKATVLVAGATLFASALALPLTSVPASAFFEFLFGGGFRRPAPAPKPLPQVRPSSRDRGESEDYRGERNERGPSMAYCVRLCDGQPFPVHTADGSAAETCAAMCPSAQTKVFNGSGIDHAVGSDGKRYSALPTAFTYRKRSVPNCTCNGKTSGGLARLDVKTDPTLRPGDLVATNNGLVSFRGMRGGTAEFAPVRDRKLADIQVRPSPSAAALSARAEAPPPRKEEEPREKRRRSHR
jgi:hypothetical protein